MGLRRQVVYPHLPDSLATAAALGLVAYVSADVAHHVVGHGGACLVAGGRLAVLTSVRVRCSCTAAAIDLAGPLANLLLGAGALAAARLVPHPRVTTQLFLLLLAAFNLFYFAGQLVFDVALRTDDWAWPLRYYNVPAVLRLGLAGAGCVAYWGTVRLLGRQLAPFAWPPARATALMAWAWGAAGLVAGATAALDHPAGPAILYRALPQALVLPLGLWFLPAQAGRRAAPDAAAAPLAFSGAWVVGAAAVGVASILVLGPGVGSGR
jgi:hypothetical protein